MNEPAQHKEDACREDSESAIPGTILGEPADVPVAPPARPAKRLEVRKMLVAFGRQALLWFTLIFCSLVSYSLCNHFFITSVVIQGKSMLPTLQEGEHYFLNRWSYFRQAPKRGDMVVLRDPGHDDFAVKRIVALPGESIYLCKGRLFVNNQLLKEPYLPSGQQTWSPDGRDRMIILGRNQYFVLGDNRMLSEDSRYYGPITRNRIAGNLLLN